MSVTIEKGLCLVCQTIIDNNLTLICQNPGCDNEIHTYCLEKEVIVLHDNVVNETGSYWYCPSCHENGTQDGLVNYLQEHDRDKENITDYNRWLLQHKHQWTFGGWVDGIGTGEATGCTSTFTFESEFQSDVYSTGIIGSILNVYLPNDMQCHTGRIIAVRVNDMELTEHLVQFKRGANDRNEGLIYWLILEEHCCLVLGDFVWFDRLSTESLSSQAKNHEDSVLDMEQVLGQYCMRSSLLLSTGMFRDSVPSEEQSSVLLHSIRDESFHHVLRSSIKPLLRKDWIQLSMHQLPSWLLMEVELEEQRQVRNAEHRFSIADLEKHGALVDTDTTSDLRQLVDPIKAKAADSAIPQRTGRKRKSVKNCAQSKSVSRMVTRGKGRKKMRHGSQDDFLPKEVPIIDAALGMEEHAQNGTRETNEQLEGSEGIGNEVSRESIVKASVGDILVKEKGEEQQFNVTKQSAIAGSDSFVNTINTSTEYRAETESKTVGSESMDEREQVGNEISLRNDMTSVMRSDSELSVINKEPKSKLHVKMFDILNALLGDESDEEVSDDTNACPVTDFKASEAQTSPTIITENNQNSKAYVDTESKRIIIPRLEEKDNASRPYSEELQTNGNQPSKQTYKTVQRNNNSTACPVRNRTSRQDTTSTNQFNRGRSRSSSRSYKQRNQKHGQHNERYKYSCDRIIGHGHDTRLDDTNLSSLQLRDGEYTNNVSDYAYSNDPKESIAVNASSNRRGSSQSSSHSDGSRPERRSRDDAYGGDDVGEWRQDDVSIHRGSSQWSSQSHGGRSERRSRDDAYGGDDVGEWRQEDVSIHRGSSQWSSQSHGGRSEWRSRDDAYGGNYVNETKVEDTISHRGIFLRDFYPEHGFRGIYGVVERVCDTSDPSDTRNNELCASTNNFSGNSSTSHEFPRENVMTRKSSNLITQALHGIDAVDHNSQPIQVPVAQSEQLYYVSPVSTPSTNANMHLSDDLEVSEDSVCISTCSDFEDDMVGVEPDELKDREAKDAINELLHGFHQLVDKLS